MVFKSVVLLVALFFLGCSLSTEPFDRDPVLRDKKMGIDPVSGVDKDDVRKRILQNREEIRSCYMETFVSHKGQEGKVVLDFDIGEKGKVMSSQVNIEESTLKDKKLHSCVLAKLKTWIFEEPPRGEVVQIIYPLFFRSKPKN